MRDEKPGTAQMQVSPEYKARCIEWAIASGAKGHAKVIAAAREFYNYVYGTQK